MKGISLEKVAAKLSLGSGLPSFQSDPGAISDFRRLGNSLAGLSFNQLMQSFTVEEIDMTFSRFSHCGSIVESIRRVALLLSSLLLPSSSRKRIRLILVSLCDFICRAQDSRQS